MTKNQETRMDRHRRTEDAQRADVEVEIFLELSKAGVDAKHFQVSVRPNPKARSLDASVTQSRDSTVSPDRLAVRTDLKQGLDPVSEFIDGWVAMRFLLVPRTGSPEPVNDGSAPGDLVGRSWRYGANPEGTDQAQTA
jgi:hypothetical protein